MPYGNGLVERSAFLNSIPRRYTTVDVADFGRVRLQSLTEAEAASYDIASLDQRGRWRHKLAAAARRRLLALTIVDEQGHRLFEDSDTEALGNLDARVADALFSAAAAHCEFGTDAIKEAAKN